MNTNAIAALIAAMVVVIALAAVYAVTDDDGEDKENEDGTETHTVMDVLGREVEVPDDLSDGIYIFGWGILKFISYFDERQYIEEIDLSETEGIYGNNQSHYYCYDMKKMRTHADRALDASTVERVMEEKPPVVIALQSVYENYADNAGVLEKQLPVVVVDIPGLVAGSGPTNTPNNVFFKTDSEGRASLCDGLSEAIMILGSTVNEHGRAAEVVEVLNNALSEVSVDYVGQTSLKGSLAGSNTAMANGNLNIVFPTWEPLTLTRVDNAASSFQDSKSPMFTVLTAEEFIQDYDFDVMFYDPSDPAVLLSKVGNQTIMGYLYGLQGTDEEKEIYVVLITALVGRDVVNMISNAYFIEYAVCGTLSFDQMKGKLTDLYVGLYGQEVGSGLYDDLVDSISGRSTDVALPLFEKVRVGIDGEGRYTFVRA